MSVDTIVLAVAGLIALLLIIVFAKSFSIKAGDKELTLNGGKSSGNAFNLYQVIYSVLQAREDIGMTKRLLFNSIDANVERMINREIEEVSLALRKHEMAICRKWAEDKAKSDKNSQMVNTSLVFIGICCDMFRYLMRDKSMDIWRQNHLALKTQEELQEFKDSLYNVLLERYFSLLRDNWCDGFIPLDWVLSQEETIADKFQKTSSWCIDRMREGSQRKATLRQVFAELDEKLHLYMAQKGSTPSNLGKVLAKITVDDTEIKEKLE